MIFDVIILIVCLAGLLFSAELFVNTVIILARRLHVSTMVIGLTVVSIGTSLPEVAASAAAALNNVPEMILGNVIGSNICNVALILGLPAIFFPIRCDDKGVLKGEGMIMIGLSALLWVLGIAVGEVTTITGVLLLIGFVLFVVTVLRGAAKKECKSVDSTTTAQVGKEECQQEHWDEVMTDAMVLVEEDTGVGKERRGLFILASKLVAALAILLVSSEFLVRVTVSLATNLGISENVLALSLIAFGTSIPELSVSISAARKGEGGILVGNVLGSNISNILLVLGVASVIRPFKFGDISLSLDIPMMIIFSLVMVLFLLQKSGINKSKGIFLLLLYGVVVARIFFISQ